MEKSLKRTKLPETEKKSGTMPPTLSGPGEENAGTVKDDDVEEFFAILRRIHVANKYFQEERLHGGTKRQLDNKKRKRWSPSLLECKDSEEDDDVDRECDGKVVKEVAEENLLLDLNADPVTEGDLI